MKRSIAFILVLILTVSLVSCAFAKEPIKCPNCGALCIWHYTDWSKTGNYRTVRVEENRKIVEKEYVRTVSTWCTNCPKFDTHYFDYMWKRDVVIIPDILL